MSPPSAEIAGNWTEEMIFSSLLSFKNGGPLPSNVKSDINPYHCRPSDLPGDFWFLSSRAKKDGGGCGFWVETGEACEVFLSSDVHGCRTTLQFYQDDDPGRKTDWVMQEYRVTDESKSSLKDDTALCRVFLADECSPPSKNTIDVKTSIDLDPKTVVSTSELVEKSTPDPFLGTSTLSETEMDCILMGDYFELNDLIDPEYPSSSSENSSCLTMTSEEYFDSMALLRELDDDIKDGEMKDSSSVKFSLSAPARSKEVVICPAISAVCVRNDEDCKSCGEKASNGANTTACSSNSSYDGKKEVVRRTKRRKMMKYLCFLAF